MKPLPFLNPAADTPAVRNHARPAIIVPIQATTADELASQASAAAATGVIDAVEWRIDPLLQRMSAGGAEGAGTPVVKLTEAVLALIPHVTSSGLPVLITVRTAFEGGQVAISETEYAEILRRLIIGAAASRSGAETSSVAGEVPMAVDIEIERAESRALIDCAHDCAIAIVASHHNFEATDPHESLLASLRAMADAGADVAKVAMMPRTRADVARLLTAIAEADEQLDCPILGISMGQLGRTSRIMGADFGSCASFAQLGQASAPGQIDAVRLAAILDHVSGRQPCERDRPAVRT